jgi:anaerobic ribonucleoside-triphosphate reductase activating protein
MIEKNDGITCVLFMGEGKDEDALFKLIDVIRHFYGSRIKIGLYTGSENVSPFLWENLDYIKLGPYNEKKGPLNNPKTNQRLYKHTHEEGGFKPGWTDITYRFWRKGTE